MASRDLARLVDFLVDRNPKAALRVADVLENAASSLSELADRGRPGPEGLRELVVQFGKNAYILMYKVEPDRVLVARIFHSLENRPR